MTTSNLPARRAATTSGRDADLVQGDATVPARPRPPEGDEDVAVRAATAADLPAVRALVGRAELPVEGVEEQFGNQYAVAVSAAGEIVGVLGYERYGADVLIRSAAVDDAWRGRGIGERLTRERLAVARAAGARDVWGLTTTAEGYFRRLGFRVATRAEVPETVRASREFASVCPSSATVLHLALGA